MCAKMEALRGISKSSLQMIYRSNPNYSASQWFLYRTFASKLFVKGISFFSTEESLTKAFSKFGQVVEAKIIRNKTSNKPKGYGYITFASDDDAEKALMEMNGKLLDGRIVFVDKPLPVRRGRWTDQ